MNELIDTEPPAESVAQKKRKHFSTNPFAAGKIVRKGVRQQMRKLEMLFFTLIGDLRSVLGGLQGKHEEQEIVLGVLCKQAMGHQLGVEDLAILDEIVERQKEHKPAEPAPKTE